LSSDLTIWAWRSKRSTHRIHHDNLSVDECSAVSETERCVGEDILASKELSACRVPTVSMRVLVRPARLFAAAIRRGRGRGRRGRVAVLPRTRVLVHRAGEQERVKRALVACPCLGRKVSGPRGARALVEPFIEVLIVGSQKGAVEAYCPRRGRRDFLESQHGSRVGLRLCKPEQVYLINRVSFAMIIWGLPVMDAYEGSAGRKERAQSWDRFKWHKASSRVGQRALGQS
jgi:hypothetical protein